MKETNSVSVDNLNFIENLNPDDQSQHLISINRATGVFIRFSNSDASYKYTFAKVEPINGKWNIVNIGMLQPLFTNSAFTSIKNSLCTLSSQASPEAKKQRVNEQSSTGLNKIKDMYEDIFNNPSEDLVSVKKSAKIIFKQVDTCLREPEPVDEDWIFRVYNLLFFTELEGISNQYVDCYSHPCWVINRLNQACKALSNQMEEFTCESIKGLLSRVNPKSGKLEIPNPETNSIESVDPVVEMPKMISDRDVYFLKNESLDKLWVFKPSQGKGNYYAKREHVASLLARQGPFPIPYTTLVTIGGQVGSVQEYIKGKDGLATIEQKIADGEPVSQFNFDELLVFDLLFFNYDRHNGQFRIAKNDSQCIYGIDHEKCMPESNEKLAICYLIPSHVGTFFVNADLIRLVDEEHIGCYAEIMNEHDMPQRSIVWMTNAAKFLYHAFQQQMKYSPEEQLGLYKIGMVPFSEQQAFYTEDLDVSSYFEDLVNFDKARREGKQASLRVIGPSWRESLEQIVDVQTALEQ